MLNRLSILILRLPFDCLSIVYNDRRSALQTKVLAACNGSEDDERLSTREDLSG